METPSENVSQELAREKLISISYSLPDKVPSSLDHKPENSNLPVGFAVTNGDKADKYRTELISISNDQPPDFNTLPVALGNHVD
ncbi:hypothetical protein L1049_027109 [Liquidambar formosana]|uniref:Uncharacterized protein n=1 Tax=Liquidambar formosana TaxID=63359 RepID=A0AAP0R378_LIQFO